MFVPIKKVAEHFGRHPDTIRAWIKSGRFPPPVLLPSGRPAWPDSVLRNDDGSAACPAAASTRP
jgi:predicted DNA-binding transcriptional regulator AlpA